MVRSHALPVVYGSVEGHILSVMDAEYAKNVVVTAIAIGDDSLPF